jgi:8-oxo-dGTP pyrophosphatase MutT (NUDIX family)
MNEGKKTVFRTEWFSIEEEHFDHIESLQGKPYYRINLPDGVLILALTEMNEIILVKQFRPALHKYTLELPCGSIDDSESPQQAAARELYEETGYICKSLDCLGVGRINMNRNNSHEYAFCGTGAAKDPSFKGKENTQAVLVTLDDFKALVLSGQFEEFSALALLVLADWKLGSRLVELS